MLPNAEPRLVKRPIEIGGIEYEPGVVLFASAYLIHHDPAIYSEPYAFRPERFLEQPPGTYTWIPFGGGRRRCLGASFALLEMKAAGFLDFATDLHNPDFAKMAEAAGLLGMTAEAPEQVRPMITQALRHDGPALVEVLVHRQELAMPPSIKLDQMTGFGLFMLKAVLSGRGEEIIDLAKVNLFR